MLVRRGLYQCLGSTGFSRLRIWHDAGLYGGVDELRPVRSSRTDAALLLPPRRPGTARADRGGGFRRRAGPARSSTAVQRLRRSARKRLKRLGEPRIAGCRSSTSSASRRPRRSDRKNYGADPISCQVSPTPHHGARRLRPPPMDSWTARTPCEKIAASEQLRRLLCCRCFVWSRASRFRRHDAFTLCRARRPPRVACRRQMRAELASSLNRTAISSPWRCVRVFSNKDCS